MIDVKTQGHGRAVGVFRYLEVTKRVLVARGVCPQIRGFVWEPSTLCITTGVVPTRKNKCRELVRRQVTEFRVP